MRSAERPRENTDCEMARARCIAALMHRPLAALIDNRKIFCLLQTVVYRLHTGRVCGAAAVRPRPPRAAPSIATRAHDTDLRSSTLSSLSHLSSHIGPNMKT